MQVRYLSKPLSEPRQGGPRRHTLPSREPEEPASAVLATFSASVDTDCDNGRSALRCRPTYREWNGDRDHWL